MKTSLRPRWNNGECRGNYPRIVEHFRFVNYDHLPRRGSRDTVGYQ